MKVNIVTGGGSGIGFEIAKTMKDGLTILTGRSEGKLKEAVNNLKSIGVEADYKTCDISKAEDVAALFEFASSKGEIGNVINSAGVSGVGDDVKTTFQIDLLGAKFVIDQALKFANPKMVVVVISSMMGHAVPPNDGYNQLLIHPDQEGAVEALVQMANGDSSAAYGMSKRGTQEMVKANAEAFGAKGARIVSVSPGIIMTDMAREAAMAFPEKMQYLESVTPMHRTGTPEDVANMVAFLVSDKASFATGSDFLVDGGLTLNLSKLQG